MDSLLTLVVLLVWVTFSGIRIRNVSAFFVIE